MKISYFINITNNDKYSCSLGIKVSYIYYRK